MGAAVAAALEMTLQEARDRVALAHGLLERARHRTESLETFRVALLNRIEDLRTEHSLHGTLDLVERDGHSTDYLGEVYEPHDIPAARARLEEALDREGIRPTLTTLRDEPERFGELLGPSGSLERAWAFEDADRLARDLEELLLAKTPRRPSATDETLHPRDLDLSAARALPERIDQLIAQRERADDLLLEAVTREVSAERYLADAARLTGGTYFARNQLGHQEGLAVARVLHRLREPEGLEPTRFSRYQKRLQGIEEIAERIAKRIDSRRGLQAEASALASKLRREKELIERRSRSLGALARDRAAFRHHLSETYRPDVLPGAHQALKLHTRRYGRAATSRQLEQEPARFGRLRGLPTSQARREALAAARQAARRLRAFETHRHDLLALPDRRPVLRLKHLETELARARRELARIPSLGDHQKKLARAVEAAGGLTRVAPYLSVTTLRLLDRALQVVRSLEGAHER